MKTFCVGKYYYVLFLIFLGFSCLSASQSTERIKNFISEIDVQSNGLVKVSEEITVNSLGVDIRRGIMRLIPTKSKKSDINLKVLGVYRNGFKEEYRIVNNKLGVEIHIGSDNEMLENGEHTFKIVYEVDRVIKGDGNHDELYWNVTGNFWEFSIENAQALIHLPLGAKLLNGNAYTGKFGDAKKDYQLKYSDNTVSFKSTRPFAKKEGLTIYVSWPKGYIEPYNQSNIGNLLKNVLLYFFFIIPFLIIFISNYYLGKKQRDRLTTFTNHNISEKPPENLSPAEISYLYHKESRNESLISTFLDLHIRGFIEISKEAGDSFKITKKYVELIGLSNREVFVLTELFRDSNTVIIGAENRNKLEKILNYVNSHLKIHYKNRFTNIQKQKNIFEIFILGIFIPFILFTEETLYYLIPYLMVSGIYLAFSYYYLNHLCKWPKKNYEKLYGEIEAFRRFLIILNESPQDILGSANYTFSLRCLKKYVPYMVALGVIQEWDMDLLFSLENSSFSQALKSTLSKQPMPLFLYGGIGWHVHGFNSQFASSITSSNIVGGFSGGGGRFSGGGFGGGGGCGR